MNTLFIMIGLSASLKSTTAKKLSEIHNANLISSDNIREELSFYEDQSMNEEVFKIFHRRIRDGLNAGHNVIADATNITLKSRKQIIDIAKRIPNVEIVGVLMASPYLSCIARDTGREHEVGLDVLKKQLDKFQVPIYEEGFDDIIIAKTMPQSYKTTGELDEDLETMSTFDQNTPWHKHLLYDHCSLVASEFQRAYPRYYNGALYHDLGKLLVRTTDNNGTSHYFNHENVGAYDFLIKTVYDDGWDSNMTKWTLDQTFLINYHMMPFHWEQPKTVEKYKKLFGEDKVEMLIYFNELDQKYGNKC